ncbi:unnamed protein product [Phytophthora lilii]|uniref:Unnamed protein product n=1 Tax=Phytophthora lilii TaxID=2077276 RepID=A0A9W6TVD4_9STRA|nr:unnamed protein product [Phytophthora lilii]
MLGDLTRKLAILKAWLKYGTIGQFESNDDESKRACTQHLIKSELSDPGKNAAKLAASIAVKFIVLLWYIKTQIQEAGADATCLQVVSDCHKKLGLFLGYRLRVSNQQRALREPFEEMNNRCVGNTATEALVVIDYKMKAEPIYYREETVDHYGKRGMSWHGAMIRFWAKASPLEDATENKIYFDHISNSDNKQDQEAVITF